MRLRVLLWTAGAIVGASLGLLASGFFLDDSFGAVWVAFFWAMLGGVIGLSLVEEDVDSEASRDLEDEWATQWRGMP